LVTKGGVQNASLRRQFLGKFLIVRFIQSLLGDF